jgi:hypothetical protein
MSSRRAATKSPQAEPGAAVPDGPNTALSFQPLTQSEIGRRIQCVAEGLAHAASDRREPWPIMPRDLVQRLQKFVSVN